MNAKTIMCAAGAALLAVGCCGVSETTAIKGTITAAEGLEQVNVVVAEAGIDTLVAVTAGQFSVEVPTDVTTMGVITAGPYRVGFVPDGTTLTVTLGEEPTVTSSSSKSVNDRLNTFSEKTLAMQEDFMTRVQNIRAMTDVTEEQMDSLFMANYEKFTEEINAYVQKTLAENTDNIIAASAISMLSSTMDDDVKLDSLISTVSEKMQQNEHVARLKATLSARVATAEGKMFTDFTVADSDGKSVSLSDYVGKGKYVLVDFWASWCGPCKGEIPTIKAVYDKYHGKGLEVVSVAVWDSPQATKDTAAVYGINWKQIINAGQEPTELYGIQGIPHIILFGPDGTILKRELRGEAIEQEISKYIQ